MTNIIWKKTFVSFSYFFDIVNNLSSIVELTVNKKSLEFFTVKTFKILNKKNNSKILNIKSFFFIIKKSQIFNYNYLVDIVCVDKLFLKNEFEQNRYDLNYLLYSLKYSNFLWVVLSGFKNWSYATSLFSIFGNSVWLEREIWDTFGLFFYGNENLRRILTDYGFEGHPFRKDFPLMGYLELIYNEEVKHVCYKAIELSQIFRIFDFLNPWYKKNVKF